MLVKYILVLLMLSGCASVPQWSPNPQDCNDLSGKSAKGWKPDVDNDGIINDPAWM